MRILYASEEFLPFRGGVAEVTHGFAQESCRRSGWSSAVAALRPRCSLDRTLSYPVLRLPLLFGRSPRAKIGTFSLGLLGLAGRFDALVALDLISQRALSLCPPALLRRLPFYLYVHGSDVIQHLSGKHAARRRALFANARVVISNSGFTRRLVEEGVPGSRCAVVYPGIRDEVFEVSPSPETSRSLRDRHGLGARPLLLCIGRLDPRKGQDTCILTLGELRRRGRDATLVLVGRGEEEPRLRQLAADAEVADRVVFAKEVDDAEKIAWLDLADLVLQPSRRHGPMVEGLGLAMAEAGARGIPVVSTTHGGIAEVVRDGETGRLLDPNDSAADWADVVAPLLSDEPTRRRFGEQARTWVRERFNWKVATDELHALLADDAQRDD